MQIAFIPTVHTLETDNTDYHMALTHLILKYPHYKEYYSQQVEVQRPYNLPGRLT